MTFVLSIPAIVSLLALSAHFLRENNPLLTFAIIGVCCFLFVRRRWVARIAQGVLILGALIWIHTTWSIVQVRMVEGRDWQKAAIILLSVALVSLLAAALYQTGRMKRYYSCEGEGRGFPVEAK